MKTTSYFLIVLAAALFINTEASAKEIDVKWSDHRLFFNESTIANKSPQLEALMQPDGIPPKSKLVGFGIEAVAELNSWFKFGTKAKGIFQGSNKEEAPFPATEYLSIEQYQAGLTGRVNLLNKENVMWDLNIELGLSNNTVKLVTTGGTGEWNKNSHFYQRAGTSLGFGGKDMKIFVEGGYENVKLDGLEHTGTIGSNIKEIDFSGTYVGVGLLIAGIPDWIKPGGITVGK